MKRASPIQQVDLKAGPSNLISTPASQGLIFLRAAEERLDAGCVDRVRLAICM